MNVVLLRHFPVIVVLLFTGETLRAESADALIAEGDLFYAKLQASEALKYYLPAEKLEPNNVRLLVHISREYRHLMSDEPNRTDKIKFGNLAVDYAKRAVTIDSKDPDAQLAVAISMAKVQPFEGYRERFDAVHLIKNATDKAIELDPQSDIGWHLLGRWYQSLAEVDSFHRTMAQALGGLPPGTYQDAATCFEKAIQLNPNRLMHYIALGTVYVEMGKKEAGCRLIEKGLAMQNTEKDDPETKREGEEVLAKTK
jgi:tetratricopeptide (TPR) repeat protein